VGREIGAGKLHRASEQLRRGRTGKKDAVQDIGTESKGFQNQLKLLDKALMKGEMDKKKVKNDWVRAWWLMPVITITWEVEIEKSRSAQVSS
jgi:hypothetical protein